MSDLKEQLHRQLQHSRAGLLSKLTDVSEYDLRRPMTPTGTNLLGLLKHLAGLEYGYLGESFGYPAPESMSWIEDGSIWQGADMWATPAESSEYIKDLYRRACVHADDVIAALDLASPGSVAHWSEDRRATTLGALLIRMIAETAQHAGHADIIRELIDGKGGPDQGALDESAWRDYTAQIQAAASTFAAVSETMTAALHPDSSHVIVRDYTEGDYDVCRFLWAELTDYHRSIYGDSSIGGDDPGAGFDDYLATEQRIGSWVAESRGSVVGLTGLFDRGRSGEVEPVVVAAAARGQGIGRILIGRVVGEARARQYEYLAIRPVARNVAAVRRFHAAGFRTLGGHIDLTMDLAARHHRWIAGASLHDLDFDY